MRLPIRPHTIQVNSNKFGKHRATNINLHGSGMQKNHIAKIY